MEKQLNHCPELSKVAEKYHSKLSKIKVFLTDIDAVLTTGHVYYAGEEVGFNRLFHVRDGYGMKLLKEHGIKIGFVSGGHSLGVTKRAAYLNLDYLFTGNEDKTEAFKKVMADGYDPSEILYIGDELFDLPLLRKAGFSATVADAPYEVTSEVDYVTKKTAGHAAVREVVDLVRYAQGIVPKLPEL